MQWINLNQNNSFVNRTQLPLLCEKSGAILIVLLGLIAGRPAVRQNIGIDMKNFTDCTVRIFSV